MSLAVPTAVNDLGEANGYDSPYRCCVCGHVLPFHPAFSLDSACPACDGLLWCCQRNGGGEVMLEVVPGRTPSVEDIDNLSHALLSRDLVPHVIVDLSALDIVSSALVAMLVLLNKRLHAASGTLQLCGLSEVVREIFYRFKLDSLFEIIQLGSDHAP
jgi:anti-anti-sigma regulatory factor